MAWIEELARECGTGGWQTLDDMVSFGKAVAAKERERCAKVCEQQSDRARTSPGAVRASSCADAIRALEDE